MAKTKRWHPSQEGDEIIFAVCERFLAEVARRYEPRARGDGGAKKASAAAVADYVQKRWNRRDLTREKSYPLFWEAARRNFLFFQPPPRSRSCPGGSPIPSGWTAMRTTRTQFG